MAKNKALYIDMCAGSQLRDTQGEVLSVEGADISDLEQGNARLNDNHGSGFFNSIGRITTAKKIFKAEDCENDRHRYYWDKVKAPYIYCAGYLYSDEDHPNAKSAAAILRSIHKADAPLKLKASVEGGVLARGISDPKFLSRTKIHSVALTFTPANNATLVEPLSLDKSLFDEAADMELIKSVMHLAETNVPSFRHIARDASATKVQNNIAKISQLLGEEPTIIDKKTIINNAIKEKIQGNLEKINSIVKQELHKPEDLDKGLKEALVGAAMTATAALGSPSAEAAPKAKAPQAQQQQVKKRSLKDVPASHNKAFMKLTSNNPFLRAIGIRESSAAKNYAHEKINDPKSMHHGHRAGGMYAMMPNTAADTIMSDGKLSQKYPHLLDAAQNVKKKHKMFTDAFNKNPITAHEFAQSAYNKRIKELDGDPALVAYSWLNGIRGAKRAAQNKDRSEILNHYYVKEVLANTTKHSKEAKRQPATQPVKKSLTAGYGGGSPMSATGGLVIQSESLEPKFKYITCDHCGKEQINTQYQVKCRHCNRNWSLAKLYNAIRSSR